MKRDFSHRTPSIIGEEDFRKYAVLVPLVEVSGSPYLIFEKRSGKLKRQPGEICLPGGKLEPFESFMECAVRETMEELKVEADQIRIFGPGDLYISPFQLMIQPFIGEIKDYKDTFRTDEVERVIKIPLKFFFQHSPKTYISQLMQRPPQDFPYEWIPGGRDYHLLSGTYDISFYQYEDIIIWGMTAKMVASAVKLIKEYQICKSRENEDEKVN